MKLQQVPRTYSILGLGTPGISPSAMPGWTHLTDEKRFDGQNTFNLDFGQSDSGNLEEVSSSAEDSVNAPE